jgi:predicted nuclease with RNAse H fold
MSFAGIDIGGRKKGFHAAVVEDKNVIAGPQQLNAVDAVVSWLVPHEPSVVALDSPRTCAPAGEKSREGERALMNEVCGIRFTPEEAKLTGNPYYEWIVCGRELYAGLEAEQGRRAWQIIEVFPTASWTRWAGRKGSKSRARWTREEFDRFALGGLPARRLNQDDRDAIAAALTAQQYERGETEEFGEILVPLPETR